MQKIVLTGAAGKLGSRLRETLCKRAAVLVSSDIAPLTSPLLANEEYVQADLSDAAAIKALIKGADMVVHFGAIPDERPFEELLGPNFVGAYNVWNAAAEHGVKRVVYASSIHAVGMHPKRDCIDPDSEHRPDGFYGLSKCFTEDMAKMYWEKVGIEAVCVRIMTCTEPVENARAIGSWLSYADLRRLIDRCVTSRMVGFSVIYGVSNNDRSPVDNTKAGHLGYRPLDNAEVFAEEIFASSPLPDAKDIMHDRHGGPFAATRLGESGADVLARMAAKKD